MEDPLRAKIGAVGETVFGLGILVFVSAMCGYTANVLQFVMDKNNLLHILIMIPVGMALGIAAIPALIYQAIMGIVFNDLNVDNTWLADNPTFAASTSYTWQPILLGLLLMSIGGNQAVNRMAERIGHIFIVVCAVFSPTRNNIIATKLRTWQSQQQSKADADEARRADLAAELDRVMAETERVNHEVKARQRRHRD